MKKVLIHLFLAGILTACSDDITTPYSINTTIASRHECDTTLSSSEAQKDFAVILSKAVSNSQSLRSFLKQNALKMYDKDYDVFYPYVKDVEVEKGKTFRELLLEHSNKVVLQKIEDAEPLLTILIPDLSAFNSFSVKKWDTTDNSVAVSYADGNLQSTFYENGDSLFSLGKSELPDFPFLVVKRNERMKIIGDVDKTSTRAGNNSISYDFADKAFDGSTRVLTRDSYYEEENPNKNTSAEPFLTKEEIAPLCVQAFQEFKQNKYSLDRDYIYYGLSSKKPKNGRLNPNVFERLYKFSINPSSYQKITDNEDYTNDAPTVVHDRDGNLYHHDNKPDYDGIVRDLWTNGNFEFIFRFVRQSRDGKIEISESKPISVSPIDLFHVKKFNVEFRHATMFRHAKWWYSTKISSLEPKWVDVTKLNNGLPILLSSSTWDLSKESLGIKVSVEEYDRAMTITKNDNLLSEFVNKLSLSVTGEKLADVIKYSAGIDRTKTEKRETNYTYSATTKNDDLGDCYINYSDPVIQSYDSKKGYRMFTYSTGFANLMVAPYSVR